MIALQVVVLCVAGGIGAALRFVVDGAIRTRTSGSYPVATTVVNVSGSLLLGLVTGLVLGAHLSHGWQLVVGTGLLGGYTTFSTASVETVRLFEERRYLAATMNGLGMLLLATVAAAAGYALGLLL
ncbi:MAG: fluoride efflux transporter CrcB [Microlunatus sp.]|nr:fluoride efflux transporter CrcB [Microlunatus sp.]MDN5803854.1 fluoride efflux transporter CrcB [Microlunatus sp.]